MTRPWSGEEGAQVVALHSGGPGALLPVLRALQEQFGYVDAAAVPLVASALNVSRADVHGVLTFYSDLRTSPAGTRHVTVCRGESCQARGGRALAQHAVDALGVGFGETAPDSSVTLDEVFCLGLCSVSPAITVDGRAVGRVDAAAFDALVTS